MPSYFLYARKSSETEDRQALSIDSQIKELTDYARTHHLTITEIFREAYSAKAPGRPVFSQMITRLTKGEATGVLCWKLDRLARNPVDGAALIWSMDQGQVQEIVTPASTYLNSGQDKFWMQLEFGMAKKYVDDLSDNVRRGNRAKLEQGWLPGVAPIGYLNDKASKTVIPDPDRFHLVRRIWERILEGESPAAVLARARSEWGLRTPVMKRMGGSPISHTVFYRLLSNRFYYGLIDRGGDAYAGAHKPMITGDDFDRVQKLLGRTNKTARVRREFAYTGLIRCGECGAAITAEYHVNRQGHPYTYYRCTKKLSGTDCHQPYIRLEELEEQITDFLRRLHLAEPYCAWLLKHLEAARDEEAISHKQETSALDQAHARCRGELTELTNLRIRGLLTDEEFLAKRQELLTEEINLRERKAAAQFGPDSWFEPARALILFANQALNRFSEGNIAERRAIVALTSSNPTLTDGILLTTAKEPLHLLENSGSNTDWRATRDGIRTFFRLGNAKTALPHLMKPFAGSAGAGAVRLAIET